MWIDKRTTNAFSKLPFVLGLSKDLIFRSHSFLKRDQGRFAVITNVQSPQIPLGLPLEKGEALRDEHATAGTRTLHL
jgi:hypothetical protein